MRPIHRSDALEIDLGPCDRGSGAWPEGARVQGPRTGRQERTRIRDEAQIQDRLTPDGGRDRVAELFGSD